MKKHPIYVNKQIIGDMLPDIPESFILEIQHKFIGKVPASFKKHRVNTPIKMEQLMKKKMPMKLIFFLIAILVTMACTAIAGVLFKRSARYEATLAAKALIHETYGLQPDWMRAFEETVTQDAEDYIIHYYPAKQMNQLGEYIVYLPASGTPAVTWSFDGTPLSAIAAQGFASDIWGAKQLGDWLSLYDESVESYYAQRRELELNPQSNFLLAQEGWVELAAILPDTGFHLHGIIRVQEAMDSDLKPDEAVDLAKLAIERRYGVGDAALRSHDIEVRFGFIRSEEAKEDNEASYFLQFYHKDNPKLDETEGVYWVELLSPSGNISRCWRAMDPRFLTLPDGQLDQYPEAIGEFIRDGAYDALPLEQKVSIAKRIFEAGMGDLIGGIPYIVLEGRIKEQQAIEAARAILYDKYGLTDEMLSLFEETANHTDEIEQGAWVVTYAPDEERYFFYLHEAMDKLGEYRVFIADVIGDVLSVTWSNDGLSDVDTVYTESSWGKAPVWDAQILPWFIPFEKTVRDMYVKWRAVADGVIKDDVSLNELAKDPLFYEKTWAAIHTEFRAAGFNRTEWGMTLPDEGDIPMDEALAIAREVLVADYGLTREEARKFEFSCIFNVDDLTKPYWSLFGTSNEAGLNKAYTITIDGKTGEVLQVIVDDRMTNG